MQPIHIIGAGLAGSEAAYICAKMNISVIIHEMRPEVSTAAHNTDNFAELVCSNSLRCHDLGTSAVAVLHKELEHNNSLIMESANKHKLPAGSALAVDRHMFSAYITDKIKSHPLITVEYGEVREIPKEWKNVIIATGPLTSGALSSNIQKMTGIDGLSFFDAIAPIVTTESVDFSKCWKQSRYDKKGIGGTGEDYINCPLTEDQYREFVQDLIDGEKTNFKEWEKNTPYFEGCLPIEVMAERGVETLSFGPMKPVGLVNPHSDEKPYAVVQLRQDNNEGTLYNMVGFQTKLTYGEQKRIFRKIPGLENVQFARLGGIHRNSFINSPDLLNNDMSLASDNRIHFAGQITGVEGYVESTAMGMMVGYFCACKALGKEAIVLPKTSAMGSLLYYIIGDSRPEGLKFFQPMNINFGLFPAPLQENGKPIKGRNRKLTQTKIAVDNLPSLQ